MQRELGEFLMVFTVVWRCISSMGMRSMGCIVIFLLDGTNGKFWTS